MMNRSDMIERRDRLVAELNRIVDRIEQCPRQIGPLLKARDELG
jgi:hypothetical protein